MTESRSALAEIWPPARVRVVTPRLELRLPTDDELGALYDAAVAGIHDPEDMPFASPWTDEPADVIHRRGYAWQWSQRAAWTPDRWALLLSVFVDGEPVGAQDVMGKRFPVLREVSSGSWLTRSLQGRGLGREMREAMLHLAFEGLGARHAVTEAYVGNGASMGVSRACGYEPDGIAWKVRSRGSLAPGGPGAYASETQRYRLTRERWLERWLERRRDDIVVHGFDDPEVRAAFGVEEEEQDA